MTAALHVEHVAEKIQIYFTRWRVQSILYCMATWVNKFVDNRYVRNNQTILKISCGRYKSGQMKMHKSDISSFD